MSKVYLYVPYEEREKAKKLGARWDMERQQWYATREIAEQSDLKKYLAKPKRIYYKIPFEHKDKAKQLGGRWDTNSKMWYFTSEQPSLGSSYLEDQGSKDEPVSDVAKPHRHLHTFSRKMR